MFIAPGIIRREESSGESHDRPEVQGEDDGCARDGMRTAQAVCGYGRGCLRSEPTPLLILTNNDVRSAP